MIQLTGQVLFCYATTINNFAIAIGAMILFGSGSSAISVAQRALVVDNYKGSEGFGLGCTHSVSSISKFIGKISIIPAVLLFQSYQIALLSMCTYTLFSLSIACWMLCGQGSNERPRNLVTLSPLHNTLDESDHSVGLTFWYVAVSFRSNIKC